MRHGGRQAVLVRGVQVAARVTWGRGLTDADGGTDVLVVHEGIPDAVPAADNETGTRMAPAKLARLVESGELRSC